MYPRRTTYRGKHVPMVINYAEDVKPKEATTEQLKTQ